MELLTQRADIIAADIIQEDGKHYDFSKLDICSIITWKGSLQLLRKAAENNPEGLKIKGPLGERPLSLAISIAAMDYVFVLLDYYVDFDEQDRRGHNPIQWIAKYSLKNATDPAVVFPSGVTAHNISAKKMEERSQEYFEKCLEVVRIIGNKIDLDAFTSYDYTAIQCAAEEENIDVIKLLVELGANIDKQNGDDYTAVIIAVEKSKYKSLKVLLELGANPNIGDKYGTPLLEAVRKKDIQMIKLLRKFNADFNIPAIQKYHDVEIGDTAYLLAKKRNDIEILKLLV